MNIKVIPYEPRFHAVFRQLNEQWITTHFKMEKPDRDALDNPQEYILDRGGHIFVALLNNEPVGVCALLKKDDSVYPYELAKMAVAPEARGQKIGFLLGQAVIEKARQLGAKSLYLESNSVLKPALRLYENLGFKRIEGMCTPYARCNVQMVFIF